jgi:hypothetical protein
MLSFQFMLVSEPALAALGSAGGALRRPSIPRSRCGGLGAQAVQNPFPRAPGMFHAGRLACKAIFFVYK